MLMSGIEVGCTNMLGWSLNEENCSEEEEQTPAGMCTSSFSFILNLKKMVVLKDLRNLPFKVPLLLYGPMFLFVPCLSLSSMSLSRTFVLGPELMNLNYVAELPTLICYFKLVVQIRTGGRQFSDPLNSLNSVLVLT